MPRCTSNRRLVELEKEKFPATLDVANHLSAKRRGHFMWLPGAE
jgi:hypothetical protein